MQFPTRIPNRLGDTLNILDLFLISNLSVYSVKFSFSLGSSGHDLIYVTCSIASKPQDPPKPRDYYCFHVNDPSLCAERITEVIVSCIALYIPHTFSNTKAKKPWFNSA